MSALDEIVKGIIGEYDAGNQSDAALAPLIRRIREGKATYADVEKLASRTGTRAGRLIADQLTSLAVDGRVTEEQARALLMGMTRHNYDVVSGAAADVQESLNRRAGLGLKAVRPEFNRDRVEGLVTEVAGKEDVQAFGKTLTQQVENVSMATVDDSVKANARAHYNAGLSPKIVRLTDGKCCKWCDKLAGVHDYSRVNNTGNDVFRRHANCRCQVLYDPGNGKKWQDAHSKRLLSAAESAKIEVRKKVGLDGERKSPEQRAAEAGRIKRQRAREEAQESLRMMLRDTVTIGTPEVKSEMLQSYEFRRKFSRITDNTSVNDVIRAQAQSMLLHNSGTYSESICFIDADTGALILRKNGKRNALEVSLTEKERSLVKGYPGKVIAMHNHPTNIFPTGSDFVTASARGYEYGIVATHDGRVFKYTGPTKIVSPQTLDAVIDNHTKMLYSENEISAGFEEALNLLGEEYGISWTEIK